MSLPGRRVVPLVPQRRFAGAQFGAHRTPRRGEGDEVAGMRPYRRGDHTSWIDWKASARLSAARGTDEFVTREFFAEQAPRVAVVCDRRPAMQLYGDGLPWLDKAAAAGAVIELLASSTRAERGDLVYVDHATERGTWLAPSRSAHGTLLLHRLATTPWSGPSDGLHRSLELLARHRSALPVGTFVFVISDFLAPPPARAWATFRSLLLDVTPVIVQDPTWEQRFPHIRSTVVQVVEPGTGRRSDVWIERGERRSHENEARLRATVDGFRRIGFDPVVIGSSAPDDIDAVFARWAVRRQRARRAVA
jgi:uncharacterized protein (DUF58 family)